MGVIRSVELDRFGFLPSFVQGFVVKFLSGGQVVAELPGGSANVAFNVADVNSTWAGRFTANVSTSYGPAKFSCAWNPSKETLATTLECGPVKLKEEYKVVDGDLVLQTAKVGLSIDAGKWVSASFFPIAYQNGEITAQLEVQIGPVKVVSLTARITDSREFLRNHGMGNWMSLFEARDEACGLDVHYTYNPGYDLGVMEGVDSIFRSAEDFIDFVGQRGIDRHAIVAMLGFTLSKGDPLALDLDGDGIETVGVETTLGGANVHFDHDGDSVATATGWVRGDDGWLVIDKDGSGAIENGHELFGVDYVLRNGEHASDGLEALRDLDDNADGVVDAADAGFGNLKVWQDANQDGISQAGELHSLAELDIASLGANQPWAGQPAYQWLRDGNSVEGTGTFTRADGSTGEMVNLNLVFNRTDTVFTPIEVSPQAQALPEAKGSGRVRDLREAMTQDPQLLALVQQFAAADRRQQLELLPQLMMRWSSSADTGSIWHRSLEDGVPLYIEYGQKVEMRIGRYGQVLAAADWKPPTDPSQRWTDQDLQFGMVGRYSTPSSVSEETAGGFASVDTSSFDRVRSSYNNRMIDAAGDRSGFSGPEEFLSVVKAEADAMGVSGAADWYKQVMLGSTNPRIVHYREYLAPFITAEVMLAGQMVTSEATWTELRDGYTRSMGAASQAMFLRLNDTQCAAATQAFSVVAEQLYADLAVQTRLKPYMTAVQEAFDDVYESAVAAGAGEPPPAPGTKLGPDWLLADGSKLSTHLPPGALEPGLTRLSPAETPMPDAGAVDRLLFGRIDALFAAGQAVPAELLQQAAGDLNDLLTYYGRVLVTYGWDPAASLKRLVQICPEAIYFVENQKGWADTLPYTESVRVPHWEWVEHTPGTPVVDEGWPTPTQGPILPDGTIRGWEATGQLGDEPEAGTNPYAGIRIDWSAYADHSPPPLPPSPIVVNGSMNGHWKVSYQDVRYDIPRGGSDILMAWMDGATYQAGGGHDFVVVSGNGMRIEGGDGGDTYNINSEVQVTIASGSPGWKDFESDGISFGNRIRPEQLLVERDNRDLVIRNASSTLLVRVQDHFANDGMGAGSLGNITFANGLVLGQESIRALCLDNGDAGGVITAYDDTADIVFGRGGDDTVHGKAGNDLISGDEGNDALYGEDGDDALHGGEGDDVLQGGAGNDLLDGGAGSNGLQGGAGDDAYVVGARGEARIIDSTGSHDVLWLDAGVLPEGVILRKQGSDLLLEARAGDGRRAMSVVSGQFAGGEGQGIEAVRFDDLSTEDDADFFEWDAATIAAKLLAPTDGDDNIEAFAGDEVVHGGAGQDHLWGLQGNDSLFGDDGQDALEGGDGDDLLQGGAGNDTLTGGNGADLLAGGTGDDRLTGGLGADVYLAEHGGGTDTVVELAGDADLDVLRFGADVVADELVLTRSGQDLLVTLADGSVTRVGGQFAAGDGPAAIQRFEFADGSTWNAATIAAVQLRGTPSSDTLIGTGANDLIMGQAGMDLLDGGAGNDALYGGTGGDRLLGGAGDDQLYGGADSDVLYADAGNDLLDGGAGIDSLSGGAGSDTYRFVGQWGTDTVGGEDLADGLDTIFFADPAVTPGSVKMWRSGRNLMFTSGSNQVTVNNALFYDNRRGLAVERVAFANGTQWEMNDILDRLLVGTTANDGLTGYATDDVLRGNGGSDVLMGMEGNDQLYGASGNDRLEGGAGNDLLVGGGGTDTFYGGSGCDTVVFSAGLGGGNSGFSDATPDEHLIIEYSAAGGGRLNYRDNGYGDMVITYQRVTIDPTTHREVVLATGNSITVQGAYRPDANGVLIHMPQIETREPTLPAAAAPAVAASLAGPSPMSIAAGLLDLHLSGGGEAGMADAAPAGCDGSAFWDAGALLSDERAAVHEPRRGRAGLFERKPMQCTVGF